LSEMLHAYVAAAGIAAAIGNHTFRATGITNFLENYGTPAHARQALRSGNERITQAQVERIDAGCPGARKERTSWC
jgi:hypothetical protein